MKITKYISTGGFFAGALLALCACSEVNEASGPEIRDGQIVVRAAAAESAAGDGAVSFGQFGFYAVQKPVAGAEALAGARLFSNVLFAKSGVVYTATPIISFPLTDYNAVYDLYGYAPYRAQALAEGATALDMTAAADQSAEADFRAADLVFAKTVGFRAGEGSVPLRFAHAMSRVDIVLKAGEGYENAGELPAPITARLAGVRNSGSFDFTTGKWTLSGDPAEMVPNGTFAEKEGVLTGVSAVMPPQTIAAGTVFVALSAADQSFTYVPAKELVLEAGKRNKITLTLNASFDEVVITTAVSVTDWVLGGEESLGGGEILPPEGTTVADKDGNTYGILRIGRSYWMDANLRTTKYNDGSAIPNVTDGKAWMATSEGAYCCYQNDEANIARYGLLYNREAVGSRKLCPEGWHVPTVSDWDALGAALGGQFTDYGSWIGVAPKLKASTGWPEGETATNESGFGGLPGGQIMADPNDESQAKFYYAGSNGYWWCDEDMSGFMTYCYGLRTMGDALDQFIKERHSGLSVRCVHDF